ncbi:hypothetical protein P7K49_032297 [Saguinus oedipus]|uniref:Uncharacterized protein n=1 Tax=Saguinus oedipus TaxID=9490 RepID=A0ABQ9TYI6_SAGOE|nr:hypothetical protein P7K49_032297 [Saguinus oedipus]
MGTGWIGVDRGHGSQVGYSVQKEVGRVLERPKLQRVHFSRGGVCKIVRGQKEAHEPDVVRLVLFVNSTCQTDTTANPPEDPEDEEDDMMVFTQYPPTKIHHRCFKSWSSIESS